MHQFKFKHYKRVHIFGTEHQFRLMQNGKMFKLGLILVFGFVFYFVSVEALECGIAEELNQNDKKAAISQCLPTKNEETEQKSEKQTSSSSGESSEETTSTYSTRRGMKERRRRRDAETSTEDDKQANGTVTTEKCMIQCIFGQLGMADSNGYPDHHLVAQGLLKNANGRELRDFLQDSTDQCFQLMEQGEKMDSCDYSSHLLSCLAEKGRSNCADWKFINPPFHN